MNPARRRSIRFALSSFSVFAIPASSTKDRSRALYGLSDSIFLLARDAADACLAGAEFFFNLAYYNATEELPVLMRGSITFGEV